MNTTPSLFYIPMNRRRLLQSLALASAGFLTPGAFAEMLTLTPRQTEGPFYPDHLPLDTDNDLLIVNDATTRGLGEVTYLSGRVLGPAGEPVRGATVEIWQCDVNGAYEHSKTFNASRREKNFQGFGRFITAASGEYLFRTIKPVPYSGRAPHIHCKVKVSGRELLTTQLYIKGHAQNDGDNVRSGIRDAKALDAVTVDFKPMPGATAGVLAAQWDIVLGVTPSDPETMSSGPRDSSAGSREGRRPPGPPPGGPRRPPPPGASRSNTP